MLLFHFITDFYQRETEIVEHNRMNRYLNTNFAEKDAEAFENRFIRITIESHEKVFIFEYPNLLSCKNKPISWNPRNRIMVVIFFISRLSIDSNKHDVNEF